MAPFTEALKLYGERRYQQALQSACTEAKRTRTDPRDPLLQRLLDEICMHSAATGVPIGFDGRLLQVLPTSPDAAWLGVQQPRQRPAAADPAGRTQEFCSIHDALEEAQDGDIVQLLPGTHVTSQTVLNINKRVMVTAADGSTNQHVILDHRANHPAFCINRSCILRGFTLDMVGFTEAVTITGTSTTVKPILQDLVVCCSGDDGVSVCGKAQPLIRNCEFRVRYCGLKQNDHASTTLWQSTISGGKHALIAAGDSQTFFEGCKLEGCGQEGVLGLQRSRVNLTDTIINGCKGPAVDMSDDSSVVLKQVDIVNCEGGIFLWHKASCEAICSHITGGSTYAVLLDSKAYARGSSCTIDGPCYISNMPGEPDDSSDGASDDSLLSSASPVYHGDASKPHPRQTRGAAAAHGGRQHSSHAQQGLPAGARGQPLSREAFKAAAAATSAAARAAPGAEIKPGAVAAAHLQSAGPSSPFGSSNGSAAGSAYGLQLGPMEDLVDPHHVKETAAVIAALFPAEAGAFAAPQHNPYGRY